MPMLSEFLWRTNHPFGVLENLSRLRGGWRRRESGDLVRLKNKKNVREQ